MKPKLDVVIVATIRAEILRMTLDSFYKNFLHQFTARAIINVDAAGETNKNTQMDMVEICREYFDEVIYNCPKRPSFVKAMVWGWQQVDTDLFLLLEDDWILKSPINHAKITQPFNNPNVVNVCFGKFNQRQIKINLQKRKVKLELFDDSFVYFPEHSLNPGINRTAYMQQLADKFDEHANPETQCNIAKNLPINYPTPIFLWHLAKQSPVIDTGRMWKQTQNIKKHGDEGSETYWQERITKSIATRLFFQLRQAYNKRKYYFIKRHWQIKYCQPINLKMK